MAEINLSTGSILYGGEWLTADALARMIQERMDSGNMKIAGLASALEELNTAMENSVVIKERIVLPKADYEKLVALGNGDENAAVLKAIMAWIHKTHEAHETREPEQDKAAEPEATPTYSVNADTDRKKAIIKCAKCKEPIEIPTDEMPNEIRCPHCNARGQLKVR